MIGLNKIIDIDVVSKTLRRMTHEIIEKNDNLERVVLFGIMNKGFPIAKLIQENIELYEHRTVELHPLDISEFRDDEFKKPSHNESFDTNGKTCILVDDVLYTGRTVRAAMDALVRFGRPEKIQLAVLIDRGHRELPIRPDYVGKNIPSSSTETVLVKMSGDNPGVFIKKEGESL